MRGIERKDGKERKKGLASLTTAPSKTMLLVKDRLVDRVDFTLTFATTIEAPLMGIRLYAVLRTLLCVIDLFYIEPLLVATCYSLFPSLPPRPELSRLPEEPELYQHSPGFALPSFFEANPAGQLAAKHRANVQFFQFGTLKKSA